DRGIDGEMIALYGGDDAVECHVEWRPLLGTFGVARPGRDAVHADLVDPRRVAVANYEHGVADFEFGGVGNGEAAGADRDVDIGDRLPAALRLLRRGWPTNHDK